MGTMASSDLLTPRMRSWLPNSLCIILMVVGCCPWFIISTLGDCCELYQLPLLPFLYPCVMKYNRTESLTSSGFNVSETVYSSKMEICNYSKINYTESFPKDYIPIWLI